MNKLIGEKLSAKERWSFNTDTGRQLGCESCVTYYPVQSPSSKRAARRKRNTNRILARSKRSQELDEVIKSIQTNDTNEVNTDRGVHSTQTVGWYRAETHNSEDHGVQTERSITQIEDSYSYARTKVCS